MNYLSLNELAIANIRASLGVRRESIDALADAIKMPVSTLKRRFGKKSPLTLEEIEQIAKHFNVAASDLISDDFNAAKSAFTSSQLESKALAGEGSDVVYS